MEQPSRNRKERKGAQGSRKVKTGCLTCKIRHKKYDERKPACSPCINTGRKCDFISIPGIIPYSAPQPSPKPDYLAGQPWPTPLSDVSDVWYFEYFRVVSAKEFSVYLGTGLWESLILRAAFTERCILDGVVAVGALSRNTVPSKVSGTLTFLPGFPAGYSLAKYNLAIQGLNRRLDASPRSWELAVLASLIFIAIETLQGNRDEAHMHIRSALAILNSPENAPVSSSKGRTDLAYILNAFSRLYGCHWQWTNSCILPSPSLPVLPSGFSNTSEARDALNTITGAMNSLFRQGTGGTVSTPLSPGFPPLPSLAQDVSTLLCLLESWQARFAVFMSQGMVDVKTTTCAHILLMQYQIAQIRASTYLYSTELIYDAHTSRFADIINLATKVIEAEHAPYAGERQSQSSPNFGVTIVQPLYFVACKCRDRVMRTRAVEVMEMVREDRLHDTRLLARVAKWAVATEEKTNLARETPGALIKEEDRLHDINLNFGSVPGICTVFAWRRLVDGDWEEVSGLVCID